MTYVSKREKIFALPDHTHSDCSPPKIKRSEGRLKQFSSVVDDRAWSLNERERSGCLYYLVTGSRTCLEKFWSHKYVPMEDLLNLLLAEKNDYIKKLERQADIGQGRKRKGETAVDELFKAEYFEDEDEERKRRLKPGCFRRKGKMLSDKKDAQLMVEREQLGEGEKLTKLAIERDNLQRKVIELQNELTAAREKQCKFEKVMRENECYKKKLMTAKSLERDVQELKIEANTFADKFKKDLEFLRDERNTLRRRVHELAKYEMQYKDLKGKLHQVEGIITENEMLNCKMASLNKLELENELLRCKLEQCQLYEMEAAESKEKIIELQCAVADQEEEMKDMLCQIEKLSRAYDEGSELDKLKEELSEKASKLKQCEGRLAEIPFLEAEVNELRSKLENQLEQSPNGATIEKEVIISDKVAADDVTELGTRYEESVDFKKQSVVLEDVKTEEALLLEMADKYGGKDSMTCEEVQNLLQASKGVISCVLEDMVEHQKEMEKLEKRNREMKKEIEILKTKMGKSKTDLCLQQVAELKLIIQEKERKLCCLEQKLKTRVDREKVNDQMSKLEREIQCLRETNNRMRNDLEEACCKIQKYAELECMLEEERRARAANETKDADLSKMQKEEFNLEAKESFSNEVDTLRSQIDEMNKLIEELRKENASLKEKVRTSPDFQQELDEKHALETLLTLLQNELDACRQNAPHHCGTLGKELQRLKDQSCETKAVSCCKERSGLERKPSKERSLKRGETTRSCKDGNVRNPKGRCLGEVSSRGAKECTCKAQKSINSKSSILENENNKLKTEVTQLHCKITTLCTVIHEKERQICNQSKQILKLKACIRNVMRNLVKKRDELLKKMDDRLPKETDESLKEGVDTKFPMQIDEDLKRKESEKLEGEREEKLQEEKEEEESLRREEEEKLERGEEEKLQTDEDERLKREEEERLKREEEERLQKEEEERMRRGEEEMQREEEEKLRKEEEEKLRKEEEEKLRKEQEEKLRKEQEEKLQKEGEEKLRKEGEEKLQKEGEEKLRKEQEEKLRKEQEEKLRKEQEEKLRKEQEEKLRKEQEEKLRKEQEEKLRKEQEEKLRKEQEKLRKEQEEKLQKKMDDGLQDKLRESEKIELENIVNSLRNECEELRKKLKECGKTEAERNGLLEKQASMDSEIKKLEKMLAECNKKKLESEKVSEKEEKLLEEMSSIRQQSAMYQEEANKTNAMNKKLRDEVQELKKLLENCRKEKANETASLPSVPLRSLKAPSLVMPTAEKQKVSVSDKAGAGTVTEQKVEKPTVTQPTAATDAAAAAEEPVRDIASKKDLRKPVPSEVLSKNGKTTASQALAEKEEPAASMQLAEQDSEIDISEMDPDFQNFLCGLNPFDHKWNICQIEKRYKNKMSELNRKHDEKVKLLVDEFQKDQNIRDKMFNNNMGTVKSAYETDIRKLVEHHKASIMRLQYLHEEEVQELNVNYETQMEAIQSQSENVVNDLTNRVAEKFKKLAEQHNEDIREVERKYQKILHEKEMQHVGKMSKSQSETNQSTGDVGGHDSSSAQGNVADAQARYNREMKKLKQSNAKRMSIMKHAYEDLLMCERRKYEKQLEDVVQRLRQGRHTAHGICQCRFEDSCGPKDPNAPLELNDVLEKILSEGLSSLALNEVALVHRRTCAATEDIILNPEVRVELLPPIAVDAGESPKLVNAKKEEFLKRILVLEGEIAAKQTETQDAINNMELLIHAVRRKLQELRDSLRSEQRKNSGPKRRFSKPKLRADTNGATQERDVSKRGCEFVLAGEGKCAEHRRRRPVHGALNASCLM